MSIHISKSESDTINLGLKFASSLSQGDIIGLSGDLGTGKTHFVKGICEYFNVVDSVNSPTFLIVNEYSAMKDNHFFEIYHFDLYRIITTNELINLGLDNYFNKNSIVLVEWIENANNFISPNYSVKFSHGADENERIIEF
ncbi:MAG: tRNA (adenosine(37)-N6)-threonylcarbamoyltransferase complex ATPase subunit type 1 TsaE [Ignavibacteria bacterium]|nr:tRNA (adenosine(37)-N6)-threonylcarbamoyltransferase complex ATPase subunit type 1 TsaE [Ignavibacteria bacterium]